MKKKRLDNYYLQAFAVAQMSPDEHTKVGALLINSSTGAVLGSGYNGFVRGCDDASIPKTRPEKYAYIIHAETNLLYNSARHGVVTEGCLVFCTLSPCINCCRALYQAGIKKVIFKDRYRDFDEQKEMLDLKLDVLEINGYSIMDIVPKKAL